MPRGARSGRRGRGSSRRAASFRHQNALQHLQLQVNREIIRRGTIRQRFDRQRTSTQWELGDDQSLGVGDNKLNNNNMEDWDDLGHSTRTEDLR